MTDKISIQAYSARGFALAIQEGVDQGYRVDMSNEGCPRAYINMYSCHMTKTPSTETPIVDWYLREIADPVVPEIKETKDEQKRGPGRPKLTLNKSEEE